MVQTNQMISYLNTSVNVQKQDSGKAAKSDEAKSSFSEALGKEISAQEKPAGTENVKTEDSQMKETAPEVQPEESLQQVAATVIPWTMQPQMMQQTAEAAVQSLNSDAVEVPIAAEVTFAEAEGKAEAELNVGSDNAETLIKADAKGTENVLFAGKLQSAGVEGVKANQTVLTETVEDGAQVLKADAEMNPLQETQQTAQTETVQQTGQTEFVSQNVQTQAAPQQTAQTMQASKTETVDMSNMKQGLENLAKTMSEQISQGKNEFEIWLEPANLGKMAVKVAYEGGKAMLSIICMSEKTLEIVSQNAKSLGAILQQNTGTDTVVVVEERQTDYLQQQAQQLQARHGSD